VWFEVSNQFSFYQSARRKQVAGKLERVKINGQGELEFNKGIIAFINVDYHKPMAGGMSGAREVSAKNKHPGAMIGLVFVF